jgi:hypothetical protein
MERSAGTQGRFAMQNIESLESQLMEGVGQLYQRLMSYNPEMIQSAQSGIELYHRIDAEMRALDLFDRIRKWINNESGEPEKFYFLAGCRLDAMKLLNHPAGRKKWSSWAQAARVLKYTGEFAASREHYDAALSQTLETPASADWVKHITADRAELEVYLGFPDKAVEMIDGIEAPENWHLWVKAFALHQQAYTNAYPFATANCTDVPTSETEFSSSLDLIAQFEPPNTAPPFYADLMLLKAANIGGIWRKRLTANEPIDDLAEQAAAAMSAFRQGSGNANWSLAKERRGRFAHQPVPGDKTGAQDDVPNWRRKYRNHYFKNLIRAGLPLQSSSDGDVDPDPDPAT